MDRFEKLRVAKALGYGFAKAGLKAPDEIVSLLRDDAMFGELEQAVDAGAEAGATSRGMGTVRSEAGDGWLDVIPLPDREPIPAMEAELVPSTIRPWLVDAAARACLPLEIFAIPAMVGLASVVGRNVMIRPELQTNWATPPNLWGAIVARPGLMKSHAIGAALAPVSAMAEAAADEYEERSRRDEVDQIATKAELDALKRHANPNRTELESLLAKIHAKESHERRYITNDPTVEKLGELMNQNPRGILLVRDELSGWLDSMRKMGREGDRSFYLEAWSGDGSYTVDRIGRGTIRIKSMCLSVVGAIQPGRLKAHVSGAVAGGQDDDGLLQRFQLLVWPDVLPEWRRCDGPPDGRAKEIAFMVYDNLDLDFREATEEPVRFDEEAQQIYDSWRDELEKLVRSDALVGSPSFESHIAKYRGLVPSLALLIWLAEGRRPPQRVDAASVRMAIRWREYLELHARKVFSAELDLGASSAAALARRIKEGHVEHGAPLRDIRRAQWTGLKTTEQVTEAVEFLEVYNWVRRVAVATEGGRMRNELHLHPTLRGGSCQ